MMRFIKIFLVIIGNLNYIHSMVSPYEFRDIGISYKINAIVTQDIYLTDEFDKKVFKKNLMGDKPTIINFV